jgi:Skp family chaperone for outer membrane proteins
VKRTILVVAGLTALAVAYFGSRLLAQAPAGGAATSVAGTRVACINIGAVFTSYKKATFFKQEMEETLKPYKAKLDAMQKELMLWQQEAAKPGAQKEQIDAKVVQLKRQMEDEQRNARSLVAKKSEQQLVQLWKEINDVVVRAAKANAFNIVLAFGDPTEQEANGMGMFANVNRKLQAIEMGSTSPLFFDPSVDLTSVVVQALNAGYDAAQGARPNTGNVTPTSGQK